MFNIGPLVGRVLVSRTGNVGRTVSWRERSLTYAHQKP